MSNNKRVVTTGKRWFVRNLVNGAVHIVIAKSYHKAFNKAVKWFGSNNVRVREDVLTSQLS